jgi:hypothetical protein
MYIQLYWLSYPAHDVQKLLCINVRRTCITIIKLAVLLLTVHNIEHVRNISFHVAHFKIKPLMMMGGVNIRHQDEVILIWWHLKYTLKDRNILALLDTSNEQCATQSSGSLQATEPYRLTILQQIITYTDNTSKLSQCKLQGFHRDVTEDSSFLGCDNV